MSSLKDKQIENSIYQIFKIFNVNKNNFNQTVDDKYVSENVLLNIFNTNMLLTQLDI